MKKKAVILFTRLPVPGKTKTRMMPELSGKQCALLHHCFLQDIASAMKETGEDLFIAYRAECSEKSAKRWFQDRLGREFVCFPQAMGPDEDLGSRMYKAICEVLGRGYEACLLVGSDIPELSGDILRQGFKQLEDHDVVLGPTRDGGYYLLGMKRGEYALFDGQTYSHDQVFANALQACRQAGLSCGLAERLSDVDFPRDLSLLRDRYRERMETEGMAGHLGFPFIRKKKAGRIGSGHKSKTEGFLDHWARISVIVPVYNEEKTIEALQDQLRPYLKECQILLVDGGSQDQTLDLIHPDFTLLHSKKGRANQMNYGAAHSQGEILFFLHSDSHLPGDFLKEIRQVMSRYRAGCFGIRFDSRHFFMWTCQTGSNIRARYGHIMFGDQGIFIDRRLFFEIGGFQNLPLMEDYQLSLTLKEKGIVPGMTRSRILTSDRRFPPGTWGKLRVMGRMQLLRLSYRRGRPVEEIARRYRDIR